MLKAAFNCLMFLSYGPRGASHLNRYAAAVDDCVTAYQWLLQQSDRPDDIMVGSESAGGPHETHLDDCRNVANKALAEICTFARQHARQST